MSFDRLFRFENELRRRRLISTIPLVRLRDRDDPFDWTEVVFKRRFHMHKETVLYVASLIQTELSSPLRRGVQLHPTRQVLIALRFFCTGDLQISHSDLNQISQGTVSNVVKRVAISLAKLHSQFVSYPTFAESTSVSSKFFEIGGFPGVVGCIDGTHIPVQSPGGENAELFRNRKGYFSINVQAVCDAELNFTNVVARWYGSAHDSRIFENSNLSSLLEDRSAPGILLGDSGYPLLPYLMTPVDRPHTAAEKRYNVAQIKTRNTIERAFGVIKRRFPCLKMLRLKLHTCLCVIVATVVLHNISRQRMDIFQEDAGAEEEIVENEERNFTSTRGRAARQALIANHFT